MDGTDEKRKISYEFVSGDDIRQWQITDTDFMIGECYDAIGTAKSLREGLIKAKPTGVHAIFYEPVSPARPSSFEEDGRFNEALDMSGEREDLRQQVRDFIKWLKAEGVI